MPPHRFMPCVLYIVLVICDSNPERVTPTSLGLRNRLSEVKQLPQGHLPEWRGDQDSRPGLSDSKVCALHAPRVALSLSGGTSIDPGVRLPRSNLDPSSICHVTLRHRLTSGSPCTLIFKPMGATEKLTASFHLRSHDYLDVLYTCIFRPFRLTVNLSPC